MVWSPKSATGADTYGLPVSPATAAADDVPCRTLQPPVHLRLCQFALYPNAVVVADHAHNGTAVRLARKDTPSPDGLPVAPGISPEGCSRCCSSSAFEMDNVNSTWGSIVRV
eukprot:gene4234-3019_t